ncbi:hypothetical protein B0T10DRAFT_513945 [Thelonectria olida]|uniref:Clr5 domain-containing protein n=1 Tax=Thelonectria olida TaxID=1576542 RepID=A0A9P8W6H4_9HYPO|nr:hypothetical protein B0T10DRAFT_513945 [Thelonectria olida]
MDRIPRKLFPQSDEDKFLLIGHKDRWECLKPVIVELYTGNYGSGGRKAATLEQIAQFMRTHYSFHAAVSEYPHHFREWKVINRVTTEVKDNISSALGRRKRPGTSTSQVSIQQGGCSKEYAPNQLKRHLKGMVPRPVEAIAPGLLSSWNLPYKAFVSSLHQNPNEPSPFGPLGATPEYLNIQSPEALTPGREAAGPSPNMELVYQKNREQNASLFLQGRYKELLVRMCEDQRRYVHDEIFMSPAQPSSALTPQMMNTTNPWTPSILLNFPSSPSSPESSHGLAISSAPTQLCRWSIHVPPIRYTQADSVNSASPQSSDNAGSSSGSFVEFLHQSIKTNDFTSTQQCDLPIDKDVIVQSLERDPTILLLDAWRQAIIAGNDELLWDLYFDNREQAPEGLEAIHPFHLAASYLDGGHTCCMPLTTLSDTLGPTYAFHHNVDSLGHTILDALMVSILRSHTSVHPEDVSYGFRSPHRFPGEEKDICGRWDADTPTVRELFKRGTARIPSKWKHPFCHTAVQAVCHSIITIFGSPASPNINTQSGLFLRRCTECGLELKLGPLHTLVVVAFYLACSGTPGETLFGALAVVTCLLAMGSDVSVEANVSVEEILRATEPGKCHHAPMTPLELMQAVPTDVIEKWTKDCQTGWVCFLQVLIHAETDQDWAAFNYPENRVSKLGPEMVSDESSCELENRINGIHSFWLKLPCRGPQFGLLWATIQAELLTYRRVREEDSWISENFSMADLKTWLEGNSMGFSTPLVQGGMLQEYSSCGWFYETDHFLRPAAQDVCVEHFMNMDVYERASFLEQFSLLELWEHVEYPEVEGG